MPKITPDGLELTEQVQRRLMQRPTTDGTRLMSTKEVAVWLGLSTRTVCLWAELEELPAFKVGRQWRFRGSDLLAWIHRTQKG